MYKSISSLTIVLFAAIISISFASVDALATPDNAIAPKTEGISFIEGDWNKALAEAKKQHKLIFLDAYTTWCGPCKLLKKNTFTDKAAGDFFNKNFINVAVDMEKGAGPALLKKYNVNAFPTLLIINENGEAVQFTRGFIPAEILIEFGKDALVKK